jgi:hypothetical protein
LALGDAVQIAHEGGLCSHDEDGQPAKKVLSTLRLFANAIIGKVPGKLGSPGHRDANADGRGFQRSRRTCCVAARASKTHTPGRASLQRKVDQIGELERILRKGEIGRSVI